MGELALMVDITAQGLVKVGLLLWAVAAKESLRAMQEQAEPAVKPTGLADQEVLVTGHLRVDQEVQEKLES